MKVPQKAILICGILILPGCFSGGDRAGDENLRQRLIAREQRGIVELSASASEGVESWTNPPPHAKAFRP